MVAGDAIDDISYHGILSTPDCDNDNTIDTPSFGAA
jgi:hypothetical protein